MTSKSIPTRFYDTFERKLNCGFLADAPLKDKLVKNQFPNAESWAAVNRKAVDIFRNKAFQNSLESVSF